MSAPSLRLPDGSRLSAALASWEKREESAFGENKRQRRSGRRVPAAERRWSDNCAAVKASTTTLHEVDDDADLVAARLLSGRRRRRYLNECLLRELGGPLRAADIAALYAPVPWGFERTTVLEQLSSSSRLLEEFRELREQTAPTCAPQTPSGTAASAWARVGRRGRAALRRCVAGSLPLLDEVEAALRAFEAVSGTDTLTVPGDSYTRLVTHALCAYLGLVSSSLTDEHGNRGTLVRRRCGAAAASHALPPVSALLVVA